MTENVLQRENGFENMLQTLQCQFLSCFPVKNIQWESIPQNLTWEQQELILKNTRCHHLNKQYPIKLDYQLNFLKRLIQILERCCCGEVHDDIFNEYCKAQQQRDSPSDEYIYKHYLLPTFKAHLTMQEAKSFVSNGTTGLCTWQASLALADFLLHNPAYISNKKVIELGAGTGLCGMILMGCATASQMALTDGSVECVKLMQSNIKRNFPQAMQQEDGFFKLNEKEQFLGAFHLSWKQADEFPFSEKNTPDLILAADVVYDESIFEDLIHAVDFVFKKARMGSKMLLTATVRNEVTLQAFLNLASRNYIIKQCTIVPAPESYIQWDRTTSVRIFEITQNVNANALP